MACTYTNLSGRLLHRQHKLVRSQCDTCVTHLILFDTDNKIVLCLDTTQTEVLRRTVSIIQSVLSIAKSNKIKLRVPEAAATHDVISHLLGTETNIASRATWHRDLCFCIASNFLAVEHLVDIKMDDRCRPLINLRVGTDVFPLLVSIVEQCVGIFNDRSMKLLATSMLANLPDDYPIHTLSESLRDICTAAAKINIAIYTQGTCINQIDLQTGKISAVSIADLHLKPDATIKLEVRFDSGEFAICSGNEVFVVDYNAPRITSRIKTTSPISHLRFSVDGKHIRTFVDHDQVGTFDPFYRTQSVSFSEMFDARTGSLLNKAEYNFSGLYIDSHDGKLVATRDDDYIFRVTNLETGMSINPSGEISAEVKRDLHGFSFSFDSMQIITLHASSIGVWDILPDSIKHRKLIKINGYVGGVSYSVDNQRIIVLSKGYFNDDISAQLFDANSLDMILDTTFTFAPSQFSFTPNGQELLLKSKTGLHIWNILDDSVGTFPVGLSGCWICIHSQRLLDRLYPE